MINSIIDIKALAPLCNNSIKWTAYKSSDIVCGHFTTEAWHTIFGEIETEEELRKHLTEYHDVTACLILRKDSIPIGFAYIITEDNEKRIISIHGGGWSDAKNAVWSYYRGIYLIIEILLNAGIRVRTSCLKSNHRAYRFINSLGFVRYCTGDKCCYFYINKKRMGNSRPYKFLNNKAQ